MNHFKPPHTTTNRFNSALDSLLATQNVEDYEFWSDGDSSDWGVYYHSPVPSSDWEIVHKYEITVRHPQTRDTKTFVFDSYTHFLDGEEPIDIY